MRPKYVVLTALASLVVVATGSATQLDLRDGWRASSQPPVSAEDLSPLDMPRAFERQETDDEHALRATGAVREIVETLTSAPTDVLPAHRPGAARAELRVLLTGLGAGRRDIVAFRTTKNRLCLGLTNFTSGCFEGLPEGMDITMTVGDPDQDGMGEGPVVWGYASKHVASVQVVVGGTALPARLGDGVYFFQAANGGLATSSLQRLVVEKRDKTVETVELPVLPALPPPDDPPTGPGPIPLVGG
jgi:hypothetical protein